MYALFFKIAEGNRAPLAWFCISFAQHQGMSPKPNKKVVSQAHVALNCQSLSAHRITRGASNKSGVGVFESYWILMWVQANCAPGVQGTEEDGCPVPLQGITAGSPGSGGKQLLVPLIRLGVQRLQTTPSAKGGRDNSTAPLSAGPTLGPVF